MSCVSPAVPAKQKIWQAVGCPKCNMTGYKGRLGIYEAVVTDEAIEQVVLSNPSERDIRRAAIPQGIHTLQQDGVLKVLRGITTLDELQRVIDLDELM